jgi:hypothetical protein
MVSRLAPEESIDSSVVSDSWDSAGETDTDGRMEEMGCTGAMYPDRSGVTKACVPISIGAPEQGEETAAIGVRAAARGVVLSWFDWVS